MNSEKLKALISPVDYFQRELDTPLRSTRIDWTDGGLCPFHPDRTRGSFHVNLNTGAFKCFSCGAKGGDIIAFAQARYSLTFCEAIKKLTENWGI